MPLRYTTLDPVVPCGDGSPAGIYAQPRTDGSGSGKNNHVIVFEGGGYCGSAKDCIAEQASRPFRFNSEIQLDQFQGSTILSDSSAVNPVMHDYAKWFVPYCSGLDMYTGAGTGTLGGFVRSGSLVALAALDHMERSILDDTSSDNGVDTLVVVGISAGTMGVVNHLPRIRSMAAAVQAKNVKIVLDSAFFDSNRISADAAEALGTDLVNHTLHPLCGLPPQHPDISTIPCCLSIHCHAEHGLFEKQKGDDGSPLPFDESFLLLDSQYDFLATFELAVEVALFGESKEDKLNSKVFGGGELAGTRRHAAVDSSIRRLLSASSSSGDAAGNNSTTNSVIWALPNCVTHPFFPPAHELDTDNSCRLSKPVDALGVPVSTVCNDTAVKFKTSHDAGGGTNVDVAYIVSTATWEWAQIGGVGGNKINNFVSAFVDPDLVPFDPPLDLGAAGNAIVVTDDCSGPNCVPGFFEEGHYCQTLIKIEDEHDGVPVGLQIPLAIFMIVFMACTALRLPLMRNRNQNKKSSHDDESSPLEAVNASVTDLPSTSNNRASTTMMVDQTLGIKLSKLSATTLAGQPLLNDVNLDLRPGTINGLLGRSGSGKSTLLGAISGQLRKGTIISADSDIQVNIVSTAYLRQQDHVAFDNLTPFGFLCACADIYGTDQDLLDEICSFIKPFFPKRVLEEETELAEKLPEPFETNLIASCSGGQRRALAVGAALLTGPSILLLDEPLSGLDSVASERLMNFLREVASTRDLTILVTVHQPSDDIIGFLDELIVLDLGHVVYNETVEVTKRALQNHQGPGIADFVHDLVKSGKVEDEFSAQLDQAQGDLRQSLLRRRTVGRRSVTASTVLRLKMQLMDDANKGGGSPIWDFVSQVMALSRRLSLQFGNNWTDFLSVPVCYLLAALLLGLRPKSPFQVSAAALLLLAFPTFIYSQHLVLHEKVWAAHRAELDDRRILVSAYYVASITYSMSLPTVALLCTALVGYAILGWDYSAFVVGYLFTSFFLITVISLGRSLCLLYSGDVSYWKIMLLILFLDNMFSGLLASPADAPAGMAWIFVLSWTHWVWSGFVLTLYEAMDQLGEGPCQSFMTCLKLEDPVAATGLGFNYFATPFRSMWVLLAWFTVMVTAENVLLRKRRANFVSVAGNGKNDKSKAATRPNDKRGIVTDKEDETAKQDGGELVAGESNTGSFKEQNATLQLQEPHSEGLDVEA